MRRERHNLSMLTAFTSAPNHVLHAICKLLVWPRRAPKVNLPVRTQDLNSLLFSNPPNPQRFRAWRHSPPLVPFRIWEFLFWHLWMTHPPARARKPELMLHLTNPCTKRKVLIITKPKGKIYKTRSLHNYITLILSHGPDTSVKVFLVLTDVSIWEFFWAVNPAAEQTLLKDSGTRWLSSACVNGTDSSSSSDWYASSSATKIISLCSESELYSMSAMLSYSFE